MTSWCWGVEDDVGKKKAGLASTYVHTYIVHLSFPSSEFQFSQEQSLPESSAGLDDVTLRLHQIIPKIMPARTDTPTTTANTTMMIKTVLLIKTFLFFPPVGRGTVNFQVYSLFRNVYYMHIHTLVWKR